MNIIRRINNTIKLARFAMQQRPGDEYAAAMAYQIMTTQGKVQAWQEAGMKTFHLSRELVEAFQHTDIPYDAYPTEFQYPFDAFMIESDIPLFKTSYEAGSRNVYNILYVAKEAIDKKRMILIKDDLTRGDKLDWDKTVTAFFSHEEYIECIFLYMKDDATIGVNTTFKKANVALTDLEAIDSRNMMNILYNAVMYITDPHRDRGQTETQHNRKISCGDGKPSMRQAFIKLSPPKNYKALTEGTGKTLDMRFIVRGHWRNQAYGEKHSLHKRTWIHPYYKGPELAEVINKPYLVK